jgi:hypothetical protein
MHVENRVKRGHWDVLHMPDAVVEVISTDEALF